VTRPPEPLRRAALEHYADTYGASVYELDRELSAGTAGPDLIDLTHGDTCAFLPPGTAAEDLIAAVEANGEAYTDYRGSASLRAVLAPRLAAVLDRPVDARSELIVTPGTQGGLFTALSAVVGPGDVVAIPDPDYFMSERIVRYLGADAARIPIAVSESGHLTLPRDVLDAVNANVLLLSHPNNPTGGVYTPDTIAALSEWVAGGDRLCVVDQLYARQLFTGAEFLNLCALPAMRERTVTLIGPSKTESMSGYRVGVAVGPPDIVDEMERVLAMASLRTAGYAQQSLRRWMDSDAAWLRTRIAAHQQLRDRLIASLRAISGVVVASPMGSSYVFPDATDTAWGIANPSPRGNALAIALKHAGVLINPGYQFGLEGTMRFRINFSQDADRLWEACTRISRVLSAP
jgi:aspartate/methionine/tyrosine aminotransferase